MLNLDHNRKFRNPGFQPGNSGIQDSYQEIQESRIPGRKFKIFQEVKRWVSNWYLSTMPMTGKRFQSTSAIENDFDIFRCKHLFVNNNFEAQFWFNVWPVLNTFEPSEIGLWDCCRRLIAVEDWLDLLVKVWNLKLAKRMWVKAMR